LITLRKTSSRWPNYSFVLTQNSDEFGQVSFLDRLKIEAGDPSPFALRHAFAGGSYINPATLKQAAYRT
jgi:hypothetical protein